MHTLTLDSVVEEIGKAMRAGNLPLAEELLWPALDQRPQYGALWFYSGTIFASKGQHALALECFLKSLALEPHPAIWSNMGACLRYMQDAPLCRRILELGLEHSPDDPHILGNLCGSYVNEGDPWTGIKYGERVINDPEAGPSVRFNLALLYLEAGEYAKGFELYATGHHTHREYRTYTPDPPPLTRELHEELKGQGKRLLVYGEQGLGDELMMATMLGEAKKDYRIIFDCHPRLEWLHRNSSWAEGITIHPTRKTNDKGWSAQVDAKVPIGNLARFYRDDVAKFPAGPFYPAPRKETAEYRAHLQKIAGDRKIIGLATRGGTMNTARLYRMIPPAQLERLLADDRYLFVSLDYEDVTNLGEWITQKFGPNRFVWHPSIVWHWDYHHTAALIAATDAVVTITQTVAHLSAAMGHPTYVLTPSRPDWRMGLTSDSWCWYPSPNTRLLRQNQDDWEPAFSQLAEALETRFFNPLWMHERRLMEGAAGNSMCELGAKKNERGTYKGHFERAGLTHVSIDTNATCGALPLDLTKPIDVASIGGPFDIVTNFGTTEHVAEQEPCWRNVHALVKPGGYLISATPMDWPKHGRWYPTETWYSEFCELNGYRIEASFIEEDKLGYHTLCVRARKVIDRQFTFPQTPFIEMPEGKVGTYE